KEPNENKGGFRKVKRGEGAAQIIPLGDPVDDGDYFLQRYYVTPEQSGAIRGFTRLKLER
ncbi:hypothetical protein N9A70_03425, partial [Akkermansiaceae bacterium]|nr:hypothetical protein [Akkermansiaceae bacterium]MDA8976509.1 hypothetical protein [bacterium]MDB4573123.1 hypothetical protein [Akkermansiaceae bacterium]